MDDIIEGLEVDSKFREVDQREKRLVELQGELLNTGILSLSGYPVRYQNEVAVSADESNQALESLEVRVKLGKVKKWDFDFHRTVYDVYQKSGERGCAGCGSEMFGARMGSSLEENNNYIARARRLLGLANRRGVSDDCREYVWEQAENLIGLVQGRIDERRREEETLAEVETGKHYLSHGVSGINVESVMESGFLCSRRAQIDRFGCAKINTSNTRGATLMEFADGRVERYEVWEHRYLPVDLDNEPLVRNRLLREKDEVLFQPDGLYGNIGFVYFVFPAGELLQDGPQFYYGDGLHLFSSDYNVDDRSGYEVNLAEKKHLLVVRKKDEVCVRGLVEKAGWIKDKDEYWRNNVVLTDSIDLKPTDNPELTRLEQELSDLVPKLAGREGYKIPGEHVGLSGVRLGSEQVPSRRNDQRGVTLFRFMQ